MSRLFRNGLLLLGAALCMTTAAQSGELFRCLFGRHCGRCSSCRWNACQPAYNCCQTCHQPPAVCTCTSLRPVVETRLERQDCVSYRTINEMAYRTEQCVTKVPVTTYEDVTVDAGCYQMVWVPRLVTQKVAKTVYQDQVLQRTVPYTVQRTVPVRTSRMVPTQHVRYVPQQTQVVVNRAPGCASCDHPVLGLGTTGVQATGIAAQGAVPAPDPQFTSSVLDDVYNGDTAGLPATPVSSSAARGRFTPAPTAASAWNARRNLVHP